MTIQHFAALLAAMGLLAACSDGASGPGLAHSTASDAPPEPDVQIVARQARGDLPGTCWDKIDIPAVTRKARRTVLAHPPALGDDGTTIRPPIYRHETFTQIVTPAAERWFETPCPAIKVPDFTASLQRALAARNHYTGPVDGEMTDATRNAIRQFQRPLGLDSDRLSLTAAQAMGLVINNG